MSSKADCTQQLQHPRRPSTTRRIHFLTSLSSLLIAAVSILIPLVTLSFDFISMSEAKPVTPSISSIQSPFIIAVGGSSCSGKSTLVQLLHFYLSGHRAWDENDGSSNLGINSPTTHILHQDKWYLSDSEIPSVPLIRQDGSKYLVQNWDCPSALDMVGFGDLLRKIALQGLALDHNELGANRPALCPKSMISHATEREILSILGSQGLLDAHDKRPIILVDGFLLYTPEFPYSAYFDIQFFLHASRSTLLQRRAQRSAYVTAEGMWQDPPEYFEQIVWPAYLRHNRVPLSQLHPSEVFEEGNNKEFSHDPGREQQMNGRTMDEEYPSPVDASFHFLNSQVNDIEHMLLAAIRLIASHYSAIETT